MYVLNKMQHQEPSYKDAATERGDAAVPDPVKAG